MTFDAMIPLASDSPADFPGQSQANYKRLQTIIEKDHQFNLSTAPNDGYHNIINMTQQAPGAGVPATGQLYAKTAGPHVQLFYMDDNGRDYQVTPGIIAAVNFNGVPGTPTLRSALNVTSVDKNSEGKYTVNFTTAIANNNYVAVVTGMRKDEKEVFSYIIAGTYGTNVTTSLIKIGFQSSGGSNRDVEMGNVIIYSVA